MTISIKALTKKTPMSHSVSFCALVSLGALMGCSQPTDTQDTVENVTPVEGIDTPASLNIATESSYKPFSFTDANGNLMGFEIDLMNALCEEMNANCDISSQEWEGLIPGLQAGKFDAVIAGMSITPERLEVVNFSDPYFESGLIFIGKKGDDVSLDGDLTNVAVGAQRSTVSSAYLEDNYPTANINLYDTQENAYLDLTSGRTRAILADKVTGADWLKTQAGMGFEQKGAEISSGDDAMGIAVSKDDPLVAEFNAALAALKADGRYDAIAEPYFGTSTTAAAQTVQPTINVVETNPTDDASVDTVTVIEGDDAKVDGVAVIKAEEAN